MSPKRLRAILHLEFIDGTSDAIKLRTDATIFGRSNGDFIIQDKEVSSTHCQIQSVNGIYHVFDMNSTNGTWVNNERIVRKKLEDGDSITIGQTKMKFVMEEETATQHISSVLKNNSKQRDDSKISVVETFIENGLAFQKTPTLKIDVTYRDKTKEVLSFNQEVVYIDRTSSFGKFEFDTEISRKHLKIKIANTGQVFVEDQGAANGVFINEIRTSGLQPVHSEDRVRIGGATLRLFITKSSS
jgi:pSer/pThr/pTyr-binding forkhead associated (FHA) protein